MNGLFGNVLVRDAAASPVALSEASAPREIMTERIGSASGSFPASSRSAVSDSVTGRAGFSAFESVPHPTVCLGLFMDTHTLTHTHSHKRSRELSFLINVSECSVFCKRNTSEIKWWLFLTFCAVSLEPPSFHVDSCFKLHVPKREPQTRTDCTSPVSFHCSPSTHPPPTLHIHPWCWGVPEFQTFLIPEKIQNVPILHPAESGSQKQRSKVELPSTFVARLKGDEFKRWSLWKDRNSLGLLCFCVLISKMS